MSHACAVARSFVELGLSDKSEDFFIHRDWMCFVSVERLVDELGHVVIDNSVHDFW